jgi:hypothetical protein
VNNIFEVPWSSMPCASMYQEWAIPGSNPGEKQPVIENWHPEDKAAFLGGQYTEAK